MSAQDDRINWDAYEQELSNADSDASVQVDSAPDVPMRRTVARRPVVPGWLRSWRSLLDTSLWALHLAAHTTAFHLVRSPGYGLRLVQRSPVGLGRSVRAWWRWATDAEGRPLREAMVRTEDAQHYLKLSVQRDNRVRWRTFLQSLAIIAACVVAIYVAALPVWAQCTLAGLVVLALGVVGRQADRPLLDRAVTTFKAPRLTSEVVERALTVLGLAGINQAVAKNPRAIGFAAPITRDGPGWRADIDLPAGVTAGEVIDRRDKLASGLGRPLGCTWPEAAHDVHPGRLVLWVGDQDMATARQPPWPLARHGLVDLFKPFPFGTDPRGRTVNLELPFTNMLIGSIPGVGKTFSLRLPLLAAGLDVHTEVWVFELKGTGDLEPLAKVAARYGSGADDDTCKDTLIALRDLRKECQRRAEVIKGLPKTVCPENKVTPQLARQKSPGLHLLVMAIDECQELFTHPDYGKEAGELAEKIIKLGRALGIILLLATQRPDAKSLPTGISANVGTRFCLRVMGQMENDMILGTSMYRNGVRSTMFTKRDKGVGNLVGAADDPQIVKTFYVDSPTADKICDRARAARQAAGTLTGHAAGQVIPSQRAETLLDDIATVLPASEGKAWSETILERLVVLRPEAYHGWAPEQLATALAPYNIETVQIGRRVQGKVVNRRGVTFADISRAVTQRDRNRRGD